MAKKRENPVKYIAPLCMNGTTNSILIKKFCDISNACMLWLKDNQDVLELKSDSFLVR